MTECISGYFGQALEKCVFMCCNLTATLQSYFRLDVISDVNCSIITDKH